MYAPKVNRREWVHLHPFSPVLDGSICTQTVLFWMGAFAPKMNRTEWVLMEGEAG